MLPAIEIDRLRARRWILVATCSLVLSGALSLLLVVGRLPPLDRAIEDPLLFRRALVVHVDLALVVWFHAFTTGLVALLPVRGARSPLAGAGPLLALAGMAMLVAAAGSRGAEPVLANYVPVIDTPLYLAGLLAIACAIAVSLAGPALLPAEEARSGAVDLPPAARAGLRTAAIALLLALLTFAGSWITTPELAPGSYYELLFWGGGHVLQVAAVAAMLSAWTLLLAGALGRSPVSRGAAAILFALLLLPALLGPALALAGSSTSLHRGGFTRLMQWTVFPPVTAYLVLCLRALRGRPAILRDGRVLAFCASAGLTLVGFALGAMIRDSSTMVPAHYHASIGAVTASFMGLAYVLLAPLGLSPLTSRERRLSRLQPLAFGAGQAVFAMGFALAGAHGMARKSYGVEQAARTVPETAGLVVMGIGGAAAVAAGLVFLWIVIASWRRSLEVRRFERSMSWSDASQPSKG